MKDYFQRPRDVVAAVRALGRSGLSVSLPHQAANGEMCFEVEGCVISVAQILALWDKNQLDRSAILKLSAGARNADR